VRVAHWLKAYNSRPGRLWPVTPLNLSRAKRARSSSSRSLLILARPSSAL
jgi:hypothetical protein